MAPAGAARRPHPRPREPLTGRVEEGARGLRTAPAAPRAATAQPSLLEAAVPPARPAAPPASSPPVSSGPPVERAPVPAAPAMEGSAEEPLVAAGDLGAGWDRATPGIPKKTARLGA